MQISRVDPMSVNLDLAEELAGVRRASLADAALEVPPETGSAAVDGEPAPGLRARTGAAVPSAAEDRLRAARRGAHVRPGERSRRREVGRIPGHRRGRLLERVGFDTRGQQHYAVRRLDLHDAPLDRWRALEDEAAQAARDYELVRVFGPAPDDLLPSLIAVHAAINDAPADEDRDPDVFDERRIREFDDSMVLRQQTGYRVLARHLLTGEWAGMSMLFVDESAPAVAFQEDTSVVRAHRGHRLGLLMKLGMLSWIADERPEVEAIDTWNATDNHHMIAVNERLGCRVIATHTGYRRDL